jgi:hypothetical protein
MNYDHIGWPSSALVQHYQSAQALPRISLLVG